VKEILHYFPNLSQEQVQQFERLKDLYEEWNQQINVISRKDTENFYERHVLHSLGIAKIIHFQKASEILDVGTGGGFPGIPMAIMFPDVQFTLVDSIGKKIKVVNEVCVALGLKNVTGLHLRAEDVKGNFDFVISRAVTQMPIFINYVRNKIKKERNNKLKNGILYLKGGDLKEEMKSVKYRYKEYNLSNFFKEEFFETKKIIHVII
jgi:16S rRNA (guanine527-N7)-methyltransferase